MQIADVIAKALGVPVTILRSVFQAAATAAPELGQPLLDKLDQTLAPIDAHELAITLLTELRSVLGGSLEGAEHPSDLA